MESILVVTEREDYLEWLNQCLSDDQELVVADDNSVERIVQLVDAAESDVLLVQLGGGERASHYELIEGILGAKPNLAIAGLSERDDQELVLAAMRCGARDLLKVGSSERGVQEVLYRLKERSSVNDPDAFSLASDASSERGQIFAFLSARPYEGVTNAAVHTAMALQEQYPDEPTLLLDLGVPAADALLFLDLQSTYTFVDAVRSVRRLDHTLIRTAFTRHRTGLTLLSLPEEPIDSSQFTAADVMILFNILRSYFKHIVINLGGVTPSPFVKLILSRSDKTLLVAEQAVPTAHASKRLINYLAANDFPVQEMTLLVDRYTPDAGLEAEDMAEALNLRVQMRLPSSGLIRLRALNTGRTIFEEGPKDRYTKAIRSLAAQLSGHQVQHDNPLQALWQTLRDKFPRRASKVSV